MSVHYYLQASNLPYSIECVGNHWIQPPINRPKGYGYFHWLATESGEGIIQIAHNKIHLKESEGILINPFVPHSYMSTSSSPWVTSFLTLNGLYVSYLNNFLGIADFYHYKSDGLENGFSKIVTELVQQYDQKSNDIFLISSLTYQFVLELKKRKEKTISIKDPLYIEFVEPAIQYIQNNVTDELTVTKVAKELYISPQYLNKLFHRFFDCSTYEYITNVKIILSKEQLLSYPDKKIQDIGSLIGFKTASHFTTFFKKNTQYTPREFQQSHGMK